MYIWNYKSYNNAEIEKISSENKIPPLIALLLKNRGIDTPQKIQGYIKKTLDSVRNPEALPDMEKATERIVQAIEKKEKITIYGDYDVDGVTATALLVRFFRDRGVDVSYYIPDRENEGYGINVMAVNKISKTGTKLLITVDCGITAVGEVELAKALGMDVIITDHHLCKEKLPSAIAAVDAKRSDFEGGFDALAGVGVAFKLALSVAKALGEKTSECFFDYVELAAVGTVADIVSLLDENRVIVQKGLESLVNVKNPGLRALMNISGAFERDINVNTIAFMLAPRINAGGRLGSAALSVELLLAEDNESAEKIASELDRANTDRRCMEQEIYEEAISMIENDAEFKKKKVIVIAKKGWHHGVIGIVASRITDKYYKPTIVISIDEKGMGKGSGRSVEGFHLFDALSVCEDVLTNFGGHAMAAGVGVAEENIDEFSRKINEYAAGILNEELSVPSLMIDCELKSSGVTLQNAKMIACMEPFGLDNSKPVFSVSGCKIQKIEKIGSDSTHLKMSLQKDGYNLSAVGFRMSDFADVKKNGDIVDVAFTMDVNNFKGTEKVQMILKDIK